MGILPTITNLSEVRIFLLILGTPFFMISTGLLSVDLTYRLTGLETQAYIVGERPGGKGPCAILQYKVDNIIYTKNSYRCLGDYKMTDVETVLYNPHNPASVCEKKPNFNGFLSFYRWGFVVACQATFARGRI